MNENNEKRPEAKIAIQGGFLGWLENFWYHYKWPTLIVAFAVVVISVCIWQSATKEKEDIVIVYAGPNYLTVEESASLAELFGEILPYDFDENGRKHASMSMYQIYSEDQIKEIAAETDDAGNHTGYVDLSRNTNEKNTYENYRMTGESCIYLLDPWLYESITDKRYLCPLADSTGERPVGAIDDYAVRLGDTELYKKYGVAQLLPADTVICIMSPFVWGGSSDEDRYQFEKDTYKAIVTYGSDGAVDDGQ